jgi:predicted ATPase
MISILIRYDEAMSDTRLLLEITPKGILSFSDETTPIQLSSLNVLIGTNGSGKSNLIDVIGLLRATAGDLEQLFIENGGFNEWFWKGSSQLIFSLQMQVRHNADAWHHQLSIKNNYNAPLIVEEKIYDTTFDIPPIMYENVDGNIIIFEDLASDPKQMNRLLRNKSVIVQIKDPIRYPLISEIPETYSQIRIYREWSFGRKNILRNPKPADSRNDYLAEDYSNLGLVLSRSSVNPDFKNAILENLRLLYQGLTDFNVLIQGGTTQIFLTEGKFSIPATRLSDGTLRYLCLLAILCDPKPPPLICIEEPELGLHPDILPSLAQLLVTAATRTQLIVTTHSEILIDALTDYPEYVQICEKTDGQTQIKQLDSEKLKIWLKEYRLGQLWMRGQLGGTRW